MFKPPRSRAGRLLHYVLALAGIALGAYLWYITRRH